MRGAAGSTIRLTIFRPGREEPFDVTVTRGVIDLEPVTFEARTATIGVITRQRVPPRRRHRRQRARSMAMKRQSGGRLAGLVLDLR